MWVCAEACVCVCMRVSAFNRVNCAPCADNSNCHKLAMPAHSARDLNHKPAGNNNDNNNNKQRRQRLRRSQLHVPHAVPEREGEGVCGQELGLACVLRTLTFRHFCEMFMLA